MQDEKFIKRCFEIALLGSGFTAPNPMVGAVLVYNNRIIGEGYHQKHGGPHAEVNAINSVKEADLHLIASSTLYVSLEPCCVYGRTPPCTNLILENNIPRVVVSTLDLSPEVAGNGIEILKNNGVEVVCGVLEDTGKQIAASRHAIVTQNRPYIILKFAQSRNGKMGLTDKQIWFTNSFSKTLVHKWRSEVDGILVGANTVAIDDPQLTNRNYHGKSPTRVVLDPKGTLPTEKKVFNRAAPTIRVIHSPGGTTNAPGSSTSIALDFEKKDYLEKLLSIIVKEKIGTLLVEGGAKTIGRFIERNLWDEARVFTSEKILPDGIPSPEMALSPDNTYHILNDRLDYYLNR